MGNKILLADDSITIQKVIELTFSDEDFEVVTVGNGRLAIERAAEVRPDVVLCDIIMPEKDGYEVCAFIKGHDELKAIPVLLLTGAFEPFDQQRAASVGADGYLAKPFEPQTLISKVRELLARAGSAPRPSAPMTQPVGTAPEPSRDTVPSPAATVRVTPPPMPAVEPPAATAPSVAPPPPAPPAAGHGAEPFAAAEQRPETQAEPVAAEAPVFIPEEIYVDESFSAASETTEAGGEPEPVIYDEAAEVLSATEPALPQPEPSFDEDFYAEGFAEPGPGGFETPAEEAPPVGTETVAFQPMENFSFEGEAAGGPEPTPPAEEPPAPPSAEPQASAFEEPEPPIAARTEPGPPEREALAPEATPPAQTEGAAAAGFDVEPTPAPAAAAEQPGEVSFADVSVPEPETAAAPPSQAAEVAVAPEQVAQIAQRVIAQISDKVVREVAWEVIPELAETLLKREIERLKEELESLKDD